MVPTTPTHVTTGQSQPSNVEVRFENAKCSCHALSPVQADFLYRLCLLYR